MAALAPILLLFVSNIFMTFAWYGQLKFPNAVLWQVVLVSWGIAFFEYCLAVWESSGKISFPRWASFLGAASYSIYLIHTFLLGWIGKVLARVFHQNSAPSLLYLVAVMGAVAAGCLLYQFVERRLLTVARGLRGPQPATAAP